MTEPAITADERFCRSEVMLLLPIGAARRSAFHTCLYRPGLRFAAYIHIHIVLQRLSTPLLATG